MTPEAVALAERLVAVVGWRKLTGSTTTDGSVFFYERTDLEDCPVGTFRTKGCGDIYARMAEDETIDLDHPSNEGHLRVLAEEVCGAWVQRWATTDGIRWRAYGEGILLGSNHDTPGQAYAAAIVAHYEGERA